MSATRTTPDWWTERSGLGEAVDVEAGEGYLVAIAAGLEGFELVHGLVELAVAIEASREWYWVCDLLQGAGMEVSLVHPLKARTIAAARIKSDRLDSRILALARHD